MPDYKVVDAAQLDADITSVADAIRAKGGTTEPLAWPTEFVSAVEGIQSGGADEGWIGDGNTHIWIYLEDGRTSPMLGCCPNGTVTVDWGDGTAKDTLTGTSTSTVQWTPTHNYAGPGDYVITLVADGKVGFGGSGKSYVLRQSSGTDTRNDVYLNAVKKVELSESVTAIGSSAFGSCYSLSSILIPDSVTSISSNTFKSCSSLSNVHIPDSVTFIGSSAFSGCYSLSSVLIHGGVTSIESSAFGYCYSLSSILIPDSVTSIGNSAFQSCRSLASVLIQGGVTSIDSSAFSGCGGVRYYDFTAAKSVPTLSDVSAFYSIAPDCEIRVPAALYDEWVAATNWSTYADHIVGVGLPPEYQPVEYIESPGGAYIDTGYNLRKGLGYDITVQVTPKQTGGVYGRWQADVQCFMQYVSSNKVAIGYGAQNSTSGTYNVTEFAFNKTNYRLINNDLYVDGQLAKAFQDIADGNSFMIFAQSSLKASARCWGCKLYDYDKLVMDLVPCYRKSDQVIGMYDKVSNSFFENAGTGEFIAGAVKNLPEEYQQVEYIESTGTQYINTGYTVKSNYLELKSRIFTSVKRAEMAVFGSDKTLEAGFSTTLNRMFAYSTGASSLGGIFSNIYDNIIDFNVKLYPSRRTLAVDAEEVNDDKNHNLTGEVIRLFGYYGTAYKFKGRIYSFQIFDNNALVLDFVPCYRKSDNVIGMFDLVSKTFFTNQGTGDFIAGADA